MVRSKERVVAKKVGGDDACSWAVLVDGRAKWDGMNKSEARWRCQKERDLMAAQPKPEARDD